MRRAQQALLYWQLLLKYYFGCRLFQVKKRIDNQSLNHLLRVKLMNKKFMLAALTLSRCALPSCLPNPPVGCVLVKDGEIVAQGYTQAIGGDHAEVQAIKACKVSLAEVIAYVTLEPCAFEGRTPSCAKMLAASGIKHVVVAMLDPDSRNSGEGIEILKSAGIQVDLSVCYEEVSHFLTPYLGHS